MSDYPPAMKRVPWTGLWDAREDGVLLTPMGVIEMLRSVEVALALLEQSEAANLKDVSGTRISMLNHFREVLRDSVMSSLIDYDADAETSPMLRKHCGHFTRSPMLKWIYGHEEIQCCRCGKVARVPWKRTHEPEYGHGQMFGVRGVWQYEWPEGWVSSDTGFNGECPP